MLNKSYSFDRFLTAMFIVLLTSSTLSLAGQSSWQANPELVKSLNQRRPEHIYQEEKVPNYTLPDPLIALDGQKVTDARTWYTKRRPEILDLFREHMFGYAAPAPTAMKFRTFDLDREALDGRATRKQISVYFTGKLDGPSMDMLIYLPNKVINKPQSAPLFVGLNFRGNHTVYDDPAIKLSQTWMRPGTGVSDHRSTEASRGTSASRWAIDMILERGYGLATIYYGDIDPDFHDGYKNGIHPHFENYEGERPLNAWASIAAWAWGLSRAMDYFCSDADIEHNHVAVLGHSRLGKTSLWAGAQDQRFALVISNNSGCGGAALSRRRYGESVRRINTSFPHWFCDNFKAYNHNESQLPLDQHMLIALMAPRPVYVASADEDLWADPRGEFLSAYHAGPVYELLGQTPLPSANMPPLDKPVQKTVGYHVRSGRHNITDFDWKAYLDFADKHFNP